MFRLTKIAFSVAMVLGVLGAASAALASNEHRQSVSGAQAAREAHQKPLPWWWNSSDGGRDAFAYQPAKPSAPLTSFEGNWFDYQNHE
jgi:hypothetical protein